MAELMESKTRMLNPILTKFITLNQIFYQKSFSCFSEIASIDPNSKIAQDIMNGQDLKIDPTRQAALPAGS